jgi:hypothetical protein
MKAKFYILKRLHEDLDPDEKPYTEYLQENWKGLDQTTLFKDKAKRFSIQQAEVEGIKVASKGWKFTKVIK